MQFNQTNNNAGDVVNLPYPTDEACYAAGWKAVVAKYKAINESTSDDLKYDEYRWCAISEVMDELLILHGDPNAQMPLGVINAKSKQ